MAVSFQLAAFSNRRVALGEGNERFYRLADDFAVATTS
jgi:hypothetical protein